MASIFDKFRNIAKLNLQRIIKGFNIVAVGSVIIGALTFGIFFLVWGQFKELHEDDMPSLLRAEAGWNAVNELDALIYYLPLEKDMEQRKVLLGYMKLKANNMADTFDALSHDEDTQTVFDNAILAKDEFVGNLNKENPSTRVLRKSFDKFYQAYGDYKDTYNIKTMFAFADARGYFQNALIVIFLLISMAIVVIFIAGRLLKNIVGDPVTEVTDKLSTNTKAIEEVYSEIHSGTQMQNEVVDKATKDLEDMIINVIQGNISISVEKQTEIANNFGEFLRHFVERTAAEIAMGIMSISYQSTEAQKTMEKFKEELKTSETNIKNQETAITGMVEAIKSIAETNDEIKNHALKSAEIADLATSSAIEGQEKIKGVSTQLVDVHQKSQGVREITQSLAKITESIKILALNMSLKVEDIKDDTGKSYGFEAMSAKVQELATEVEKLLDDSTELITPTIEAIEQVSEETKSTMELINSIATSIQETDDATKAIAGYIEKQATDINRIGHESENLQTLATQTTASIEAQTTHVTDVDEMLTESQGLVETVKAQTQESVESAREINDLMEQLKTAMATIESGTGLLTEKSAELSDMFDTIKAQALKNMEGANRLENVTSSVKEASNKLVEAVKG